MTDTRPTGFKPTLHVETRTKDGKSHVNYVITVGSHHVKFDVAWWDSIAERGDDLIDEAMDRRAKLREDVT